MSVDKDFDKKIPREDTYQDNIVQFQMVFEVYDTTNMFLEDVKATRLVMEDSYRMKAHFDVL